MTVFDTMVDTLFADPNLAVAATFQHGTVAPVGCLVALKRPDREAALFASGGVVAELVAEVRASEVPAPVEGDTLTIAGTVYTIRRPERDRDRLVWSLPLREPS